MIGTSMNPQGNTWSDIDVVFLLNEQVYDGGHYLQM